MAKKKEIQIINLLEIKSETSKTSFFLFNHEASYRRLRIFRREKRVRGDRKLGSNNESRSGKRSNGCAADYAHSECSRQLGHGKDKKGGTDDPCPSASPSGSIPGYPRSLISLPDKLDYGVSSCPPLLLISPPPTRPFNSNGQRCIRETLFSVRKQPFFLFIASVPPILVQKVLKCFISSSSSSLAGISIVS